MVLICPGRMTKTHGQFLADHPTATKYKYLGVDVGSADFLYESESPELTLCTNEKFILELHKFLSMPRSTRIVREVWEQEFLSGTDIVRSRDILRVHNHRSVLRLKVLRDWKDVAKYYCLLAQAGYSYHYEKRKLVVDLLNPITPPYDRIDEWRKRTEGRRIRYRPKSIYCLPTSLIDTDTAIYIHLPLQFGQYGCGYAWSRRKLAFMVSQLTELAGLGYRIVVSAAHGKYGREMPIARNLLPQPLFTPFIYYELKAKSKYGFNNSSSEVFYCANF